MESPEWKSTLGCIKKNGLAGYPKHSLYFYYEGGVKLIDNYRNEDGQVPFTKTITIDSRYSVYSYRSTSIYAL